MRRRNRLIRPLRVSCPFPPEGRPSTALAKAVGRFHRRLLACRRQSGWGGTPNDAVPRHGVVAEGARNYSAEDEPAGGSDAQFRADDPPARPHRSFSTISPRSEHFRRRSQHGMGLPGRWRLVVQVGAYAALRDDGRRCMEKCLRVPGLDVNAMGNAAGQAFAEATLLVRFFDVADDSGLAIPGDSPSLREKLGDRTGDLQLCFERKSYHAPVPWPESDWIPIMAAGPPPWSANAVAGLDVLANDRGATLPS